MVRKKKASGDEPLGEMTVMVFQLKGSDETIQTGIRTIHDTVTRTIPGQQSAVISAPTAAAMIGKSDDDSSVEAELDGVVDAEFQSSASSSSGGSRKRTVRSPVILDLAFDDAKVPLEDYLACCTDTINMRYLMISVWLKEQLEVQEVAPDHIHTCYRRMGWHTPKDAAQPLRTMKSREQFYGKGEAKGSYAINHVGENVVHKHIEENAKSNGSE